MLRVAQIEILPSDALRRTMDDAETRQKRAGTQLELVDHASIAAPGSADALDAAEDASLAVANAPADQLLHANEPGHFSSPPGIRRTSLRIARSQSKAGV